MSATTYGDAIERVRYLLRSYTGQHEVTTHLASSITASDTTLPVNDGNAVSTGIVEIGDELVWVDSQSGGSLSIPPYGRGYMGTTAATHASGTQVITDPFFPRKSIADAIVDTQRAVYPKLWKPATVEFTFTPSQATYNLASTADRVLSVSWQTIGPSQTWLPLKRWTFDNNANTTSFPTGSSLTLHEAPHAGQTVRVVYAAPFTEFSASSDTLTAAGHQASHFDVLVYGAAWRLVQFLEVSRLNLNAVENQERGKFFASGAASALTRQLLAIYEQRLAEERDRLRQLYPIQTRFSR